MNYKDVNSELFSRVLELTRLYDTADAKSVNKMAHETLVLTCHEGLRDTGQAFGNLFSQVDYLCKRHNVKLPDWIAVQAMRRHTNSSEPLSREDFFYDMRALSRFISAVTGTDVPGELLRVLPAERKPYTKAEGTDVRYVRCIVRGFDDKYIYVSAEEVLGGAMLAADYTADDLTYLSELLREGMQLNLLDCKLEGSCTYSGSEGDVKCDIIVPSLVIVEPDYLIDISSIAACFKEYGHHPLIYTLDRMKPRANSQAILLGNLAGSVLDDIINSRGTYSMASTLKSSFSEKALEYSTCTDFNPAVFKANAAVQASNINAAVMGMFGEYDRSRVVLEPSFVCERLGLQGRVDLMTTDFRLLVEQKSGRNLNIERAAQSGGKGLQLEPHYVQLLLYYGVLRYNFNLGFNKTDIRLLYSKYPPAQGFLAVAFYRKLFAEAISLRNKIVAADFDIALDGFDSVLPELTPATLNTTKTASSFFQRYLLPQIEAVTGPLAAMPPLEREYFCRMMTFVYREQLLGKVGSQEGVTSCSADLWNMPLAEKLETGNIYTGLTIKAKECAEGSSVPDRITLSVPGQGEGFLPNFRRGDMIYLYQYRADSVPDVRNAILYKGNIDELHTDEITVVLTDGQQNPDVLQVQHPEDMPDDMHKAMVYAVEHAGTDASGSSGARALLEFVTAPDDRRSLLLGQRAPRRNDSVRLTKSYNPSYDDILLGAMQASDYYLLVGPPGTGKTSMALRFMVEEELTRPGASVLLMAYTNRAVDEICAMLEDASLDYLRLGSEYSCDRRFKHRLIGEAVRNCPRLSDIRERISSVRIITATTSMLMSRPFVFSLKHFSLAIVDEASQILEPGLIGLLAAHDHEGGLRTRCSIDRFILVGDHKQLPAVVLQSETESDVSSEALRDIGLDNCRNSLFERLLRTERAAGRTEFTGVLRRHGRMHPDVAEFPCREFYASEHLEPVPLKHQKETSLNYADTGLTDKLDTLLRTHRMIFIPSQPCRRPDVSDKVNTSEATIVADLLSRLYSMLGSSFSASRSVGVIVPYRNQIAVIRKEIEKTGIKELEDISIDTVERYQGSQRDVIIYSFTVQNRWQLEFLAANCFMDDARIIDRKLNVAMTRARRQMIMTGNVETLSYNAVFREMISYVESKGGLFRYYE